MIPGESLVCAGRGAGIAQERPIAITAARGARADKTGCGLGKKLKRIINARAKVSFHASQRF